MPTKVVVSYSVDNLCNFADLSPPCVSQQKYVQLTTKQRKKNDIFIPTLTFKTI